MRKKYNFLPVITGIAVIAITVLPAEVRMALAAFKADFLNGFVIEKNVESVLELGCGDGNQLASSLPKLCWFRRQ